MAAQTHDEDKAPTSLWERLQRPAPAPRPSLTPQQIAETAVKIADAEGLDAITMRRLATELGVAPMAAYRYVSSKDDILELMIDLVYAELDHPDTAGWREALRAVANHTRALMLKHPWLAHITSPPAVLALTPNRMVTAERTLTGLEDLGLDADTMMAIARTVDAYVHGATQAEIALRELMRDQDWSTGHEVRTGLAPQMTWLLNTGRYPAFQRYTREAARKDDPQWHFETGLDFLLDGIAARLGAGPPL
jgi:AcrR family transcriptional regulator